jgi:hypothetical protein
MLGLVKCNARSSDRNRRIATVSGDRLCLKLCIYRVTAKFKFNQVKKKSFKFDLSVVHYSQAYKVTHSLLMFSLSLKNYLRI